MGRQLRGPRGKAQHEEVGVLVLRGSEAWARKSGRWWEVGTWSIKEPRERGRVAANGRGWREQRTLNAPRLERCGPESRDKVGSGGGH